MTITAAPAEDITVTVRGETIVLSRDEAETLLADLTDALGGEPDSPSQSFSKLFTK